ncbi:MAG: SLBB domain-containing protein [Rhodothermales bacterium]
MVCLLGFISLASAQAQSLDDLRRSSGAYYRFASESDITIEVKVWGAVRNTGLYEVRQGLKLSTLLSLAGGPQSTARDARTKSTFTVRLLRLQPEGHHAVIAETVMENEILLLDQDPTLLSGDVLVAEEQLRQRFGWRDGVTLVTALGTLTLIVERLIGSN